MKLQRIIIITVYTGAGGKRNEIRSCLDNVIIHRHFCSDFNNLLSSKRCDFASVNSARVEFEDKLSCLELKYNRVCFFSPFVSGNHIKLVFESLCNENKVS